MFRTDDRPFLSSDLVLDVMLATERTRDVPPGLGPTAEMASVGLAMRLSMRNERCHEGECGSRRGHDETDLVGHSRLEQRDRPQPARPVQRLGEPRRQNAGPIPRPDVGIENQHRVAFQRRRLLRRPLPPNAGRSRRRFCMSAREQAQRQLAGLGPRDLVALGAAGSPGPPAEHSARRTGRTASNLGGGSVST